MLNRPTTTSVTASPAHGRRPRTAVGRAVSTAADLTSSAVPAAALTLAVAVVATTALEIVHAGFDPVMTPLERLNSYPVSRLALNVVIVWAVVLAIFALTGRVWAASLIAFAGGTLTAVADHQKMALRSEPLYPTDLDYLLEPQLLLATVGLDGRYAVAAAAMLGALILLVVTLSYHRSRRSGAPRWRRLCGRAAAAAAAASVLVPTGGFTDPDNPVRAAYDSTGTVWARWDQYENFLNNGFVAGVLYNLPGTAMEEPDDYGPAAMDALLTRYGSLARATNLTREGSLDDTNVVVVLGESFADPTRLTGLEPAEDPMPFTRALMARTTSGQMLASGYGGGTANVEFEVLTGMSLRNFNASMSAPYPMLIPHHESFPSFVGMFAEGRQTLAIHPFLRRFYKRDEVYPRLGFDRSMFAADMPAPERIENNPYVSDAATFRTVVDELKASRAPMFINAVTMQNHWRYEGKYSNPIDVTGPLSGSVGEDARQWLRDVRHTDHAIEQLVADLEALDERTIVLYYGDHLATVWPDEVRSAVEPQVLYETPWFVWSNFPAGALDPGAEVLAPYYLVNQLVATADAPATPYNALLEKLQQEIPAAGPHMMLDASGDLISPEDLSDRAVRLLEDYRMVQFDMSVGRRYVADEFLTVPAP